MTDRRERRWRIGPRQARPLPRRPLPSYVKVPPAGAVALVATEWADRFIHHPLRKTMPEHHHPSHNSVMTYQDNRSVILFVTVTVDKRLPVLANELAHACIINAWQAVRDWIVGRYVIMPDHLHFFCSPATCPPEDFHRWMRRWKAQVSRTFPIGLRMVGERLPRLDDWAATSAAPPVPCQGAPQRERSRLSRPTGARGTGGELAATSAAIPKRLGPLLQHNCWDRQLRSGESYSQKWQYVRNNPVRKGLVANVDEWPYQGELNMLQWHEKV